MMQNFKAEDNIEKVVQGRVTHAKLSQVDREILKEFYLTGTSQTVKISKGYNYHHNVPGVIL